jgi:PAS domain S-box-containing protein
LIVHTFGRDFSPFDSVARRFRAELGRLSPGRIEFVEASLEMARFDGNEREGPLLAFLAAVFEKEPPALLVPIGAPAAMFCQRNRAVLFPATPLLAVGLDKRRAGPLSDAPLAVSATIDLDLVALMEGILSVRPGTRHVHIVTGAAPLEQYWTQEIKRAWAPFGDRVQVHSMEHLSVEQMKTVVSDLPADAVVFHAVVNRDAAGVTHESENALDELVAVANVPSFGFGDNQMGHGIVGGKLMPFQQSAEQAAAAAVRLLAGEAPSSLHLEPVTLAAPIYDWRELSRWGIRESALPAGSTVLFRPPGLWETHRGLIVFGGTVAIAQTVLIIMLLTARKRARESAASLSLAADTLGIGVWQRDTVTDEITVSDRWRDLFGLAHSGPVRLPQVMDRIPAAERDAVVEAIELGNREGRSYHLEHHVSLPDGSTRWIATMGRVDTSGGDSRHRRTRGISMDITERKKAEQDLASEQRLTGAIFDSVPGLLYLYDQSGRLVRWNKKHESLTGYTAAELAGKELREWFDPENVAGVVAAWEEVFTSGETLVEINLRLKDGSFLPCLATGTRLDIDGQPHLVGIAIDITELKRAETEVRQQRNQLAHLSRVATLGELSGSLAHELNQPLGAILANAQTAQRLLARTPPALDDVGEILEDIVAADRRAEDVIKRLRSLLQHGEASQIPLDLNACIREVLRLMHRDLLERGVTVQTNLSETLPQVSADNVQLQQIFLNLIVNACDAMADLPQEQRQITLCTHLEDGVVTACVQDCGPGLPEDVEVLFKAFHTTKATGLGMGLTICRTLAQAHHGRLWARPHPAAAGAVLCLSLPPVA